MTLTLLAVLLAGHAFIWFACWWQASSRAYRLNRALQRTITKLRSANDDARRLREENRALRGILGTGPYR